MIKELIEKVAKQLSENDVFVWDSLGRTNQNFYKDKAKQILFGNNLAIIKNIHGSSVYKGVVTTDASITPHNLRGI